LEGQWSPPGPWSDNPFASVRTFGSRYFYLGGDRVIAARLDGGVAWPLGDAVDLVADNRFYAGGVSSQRGYKRRRLGPVDSADQPIGGEVRVLAGMEARLPFWSVFGLAAFVDSGQVWRYTSEVDFSEYTVSGGLGLMLRTPIGPIRLDWATNITKPQRNEPQSVFHFAIGHPY
jgi:outer membrane protein assembly factor BamA